MAGNSLPSMLTAQWRAGMENSSFGQRFSGFKGIFSNF